MHFSIDEVSKGTIKACVIPRPIAWVSTLDENGVANLAPYSFFNLLTNDPSFVVISSTDKHISGGRKDTLRNIEMNKQFVINIPTYKHRHQVNLSSTKLPRGVSEFEYAKIESAPSKFVKPPRVKDCPIALECYYVKSIQLERPIKDKNSVNRLIIGKIVGVYIESNILTNGKIDPDKFQPIARLGYNQYAVLRKIGIFQMDKPYKRDENSPVIKELPSKNIMKSNL